MGVGPLLQICRKNSAISIVGIGDFVVKQSVDWSRMEEKVSLSLSLTHECQLRLLRKLCVFVCVLFCSFAKEANFMSWHFQKNRFWVNLMEIRRSAIVSWVFPLQSFVTLYLCLLILENGNLFKRKLVISYFLYM